MSDNHLPPMQRPDSLETWLFLLDVAYQFGAMGAGLVADSNAADRAKGLTISMARELLEANLALHDCPFLPELDEPL